MTDNEAIEYLEKLEVGNFLTINIPIIGDEKISVTAMYMGKHKDGRYNFTDNSRFIFSKEFIEKGKITIDKKFDEDKALDIHANIKRKQERTKKHKEIYLR